MTAEPPDESVYSEVWRIGPAEPSTPPVRDGKALAWVRVTLEYPIECEPHYLEMTQDDDLGEVTHGTWHRSMGTWCGDNLLEELEEALELIRGQTSWGSINSAFNRGCLCDVLVGHDVTVKADRTPPPPSRIRKRRWWRGWLGRWRWRFHYRQWGPVDWDPHRPGKPHFWEGSWRSFR